MNNAIESVCSDHNLRGAGYDGKTSVGLLQQKDFTI